jgi:8-oxo-dGTP pyrophosphatase MutT (NUDIX family)
MRRDSKKGVAVVPIYKGRAVLLKQYRKSYKEPFWNIVMGGLKNGEKINAAIKRECEEEIGTSSGKFYKLTETIQLPGSANVHTAIFYVVLDEKPFIPKECTEPIKELAFLKPAQLRKWIKSGKIIEATTLLGVTMVLDKKIMQSK